MLPAFILPETTIREAGTGPALELGKSQGGLVLLTLGITRIIEQESLDVSVSGSPDGANWGPKAPRQRTSAEYWKQPLKWIGNLAIIGGIIGTFLHYLRYGPKHAPAEPVKTGGAEAAGGKP